MLLSAVVLKLMVAWSGPALAQSPECVQLKQLESSLLANLPVSVDELTDLVGLNVNCDQREVHFVKHLRVPASALEEGIEATKQQQYRSLHCNNNGFATRGWTARDYIYDNQLELVMSLRATPRMC